MNITRDAELRTRLTSLSSEKGKYYFLGIGIDKYKHHKPLHNAVKDVDAIKNLLIEKYQFESSPLIFLKDELATRTKILEAFSIISKPLTKKDNLLIYYAGHGMLDEHNDGYLVPVEEEEGSRGLAIEFHTVKKFITNSKARNVLFIADCCYAARIFDKSRSSDSKKIDNNKLIEAIRHKKSRWVLASGREEVLDGSTNSPFAKYLIEYLEKNTDKPILISELSHFIKYNVQTITNQKQIPEGYPLSEANHEGGEIVFYP